MTEALPGSDANPILLDVDRTNMGGLAHYDHIHDLHGTCIKRRAGDLCELPETNGLLAYLEHAENELKPMVSDSKVGLILANGIDTGGDPDVKAAMELGLLLLMGKPVIVVCSEDTVLPAGLERAAAAVVRGELGAPGMQARLGVAIQQVTSTL